MDMTLKNNQKTRTGRKKQRKFSWFDLINIALLLLLTFICFTRCILQSSLPFPIMCL